MAANEAEKAAPNAVINDLQMLGATGGLFISGTLEDMRIARDTFTAKPHMAISHGGGASASELQHAAAQPQHFLCQRIFKKF